MKLSLPLLAIIAMILTSCDGTDRAGNGANTGQRGGPNSASGRPGGDSSTESETPSTPSVDGTKNAVPSGASQEVPSR